MLNNIQFYSMEQSNNSRYYQSNRSSPELAITNGIHQHLNNHSYHYHPIPSPPLVQCSAYFISRVDLSNYTLQTLKQTIDNVVSGPKSKGLKVKLSLPDDGLIIDNVPDPNQSWMYRTSELLYFWRDPYYVNIIIVITLNRTNYQRSGPYSATIFRLRGNESVQLFLQRAQQFFAQLSSKNNQKKLFEKSATTEYMPADDNHRHHRKRSRHRSKSQKRSAIRSSPSSKTKSVPPVIHTEFDPKQITTTDSIFNLYNRRTYSETTLSSDTRTSNSKQSNNHVDDDDEKMTTVSNYLPTGYFIELVRELKELRNEIAALKLEARITPVRSTSTSPLVVNEVHSKERMNSSQSEMDAQTQTDFSLMNIDRQQLSEKNEIKMDVSNGISVTNKRKNEQSNTKVNKRTYLNGTNNIGSNREESTLVNSSSINGSSNGISSFYPQEGHQPTSYPSKPRPMIINYQNGTTMSKPKIIEKNSSSIPMETESSFSLQTGEVVSFRSSLEDTIAPPENIYENMPIFHPVHSNQSISTNENDQQKGKPYLYVTIAGNHNSETQQQYLSQLFGPQNGISLLIPPESLQNKTNTPSSSSSIPPETISNNQNYFSHVLFSDHLTNPLFNVDKQLLANTIANQFGIDPNSPDLQKLIANQHLFVTNKRTFANMVWQITPEEASALCSSPVTSNSTIPDISAVDANNPTAKPILKSKASSHLASKGQHISWDTTLD